MEVNLDLYKTFYYVCEFKNITKVADFFYVTQPAITKKLKNLENQLECSLIIRNTKGIELTNDGKRLYNLIKPSIENLNEIGFNFMKKIENHDITIRICAGYSTIKKILLPAMSEFNEKYPNIKFEMSTCSYQESIQKMKSGELDLNFFSENQMTEKSKDFIIKECYHIQDGFVVSNKIRKNFPDKISLKDINNYPIIAKNGESEGRKIINTMLKEIGIEFIPKYELSNNWLIEEYVKLGLGIGFLILDYVKDEIELENMAVIPIIEDIPKRKICYAYRKNNAGATVIKEFLSILKDKI